MASRFYNLLSTKIGSIYVKNIHSNRYNHLFSMRQKAKLHDNDLRNDIVDDATSTMEFNDCDDIVEG